MIDHVALTVPDIEEATLFFQKVFNAKIVLEGHRMTDAPWKGKMVETRFHLPQGGQIRGRRVLSIGGDTHIELFCFEGMEHRQPLRTFDYGIQHFAIYVKDLQETALKILNAGGQVFVENEFIEAIKHCRGPREGWLYTQTPWGSIIEIVTFREVS